MPGLAVGRRPALRTKQRPEWRFLHRQLRRSLLNDNASIIFNGSVHNYMGQAGLAAYAATKGGVVSMARAIAADLAPRNIRVNVVAPGATKTPIWRRGPRASMSGEQSAKVAALYSSTVPLG